MPTLRRLVEADRPALRQFWLSHWGADFMVARGRTYRSDQLDGFIAGADGEWLGLVTFYIEQPCCEIISLDSLRSHGGTGTALVRAVEQAARQAGCQLLKLITTNDNTQALRFYQKLGFELVALYPRAVERSRLLKPSIPLRGNDGIPIRDELELELRLAEPRP